MEERVVLVDDLDNEIGTEEKMKAHVDGKLHRAFSIFVFNSKGEMLIQQRDSKKYHCGGLWTNTCCSHPRPGEVVTEAVHRRLREEMGIDCSLKEMFKFTYLAKFSNGLVENETDHVFFGICDSDPILNKNEAMDYRWVSISFLMEDMEKNPDTYTPWFKIAVSKFILEKDVHYENS